MKPRLRLKLRIWDCCLPDWRVTGRIGYGLTPEAAYDEWVNFPTEAAAVSSAANK